MKKGGEASGDEDGTDDEEEEDEEEEEEQDEVGGGGRSLVLLMRRSISRVERSEAIIAVSMSDKFSSMLPTRSMLGDTCAR